MASETGLPFPDYVLAAVAAVVLLASLWVVRRLDEGDPWGRRLRVRLVMGVPWGTLFSVLGVLSVYLFVQGGLAHWYRPVTIPFRATSYLYPLGMLAAPFSHGGPNHLVGNLIGTVAVAPIVEYAWGHYPTERGSSSFSGWRTNPWLRALVVFPAAVCLVGVATSVFALGPVIGFSGVVFAFIAFAIVTYPVATLVSLLGVQRVLNLVYNALLNPVTVSEAKPSGPSAPWWANIAIQGHALGLFIGFALGVAYLHQRDRRPKTARVWLAVLVVAIVQNLWAVYFFRGNETYVLFRAAGTVVVAVLALVVTGAVVARKVPVVEGWDLTRAQVGLTTIVLLLAVVSGAAVPTKFVTVGDDAVPESNATVEVRDYTVTYAENTPYRLVSAVDVPFMENLTDVRTSGVIVVSEQRHLWTQSVSTGQLAFRGFGVTRVGGVGWRETVWAVRRGWTTVGNGSVYHVWLRPAGGERRLAFTAPPRTAEPIVAGRNVTVVGADGEFYLRVTRNDSTLGRADIPDAGNRTSVGGLTFASVEQGRTVNVFAIANETRVKIASKETYCCPD